MSLIQINTTGKDRIYAYTQFDATYISISRYFSFPVLIKKRGKRAIKATLYCISVGIHECVRVAHLNLQGNEMYNSLKLADFVLCTRFL